MPRTNSQGRRTTRTQRVYEFKLELDGEHEYSASKDYDFELDVPELSKAQMPEGTLGDIAGAAMAISQMTGMSAGPPQWYINVSLDIPGAKDVSKQIQINVV